MTDWRAQILNRLLCADNPLIVALDPDHLLLEEGIFQDLQKRQIDLLTYTDPITFRHTYEPQYREQWDTGEETQRLIVRFPHARRESVPYDLLQRGEYIKITLADLFPNLYYQTMQAIDPGHYDALFEATRNTRGKRLGPKQTAAFILDQIFSIRPESVRSSADLIALLCQIHYRHQTVPDVLIDHCLETWRDQHHPGIPATRALFEHDTFMAYLQDQWARYISGSDPAPTVPFDNDGIRLYIDTFFLEGALKPLPAPPSARVPGWAHCGVIRDQNRERIYRLETLLNRIAQTPPGQNSRLDDWKQCARLWAEAIILFSGLSSPVPEHLKTQYHTLHQTIETAFGEWIRTTFPTLPDRPYLPAPVMVHQIPHYLAHKGGDRIALIVMDGMALDQWLIIKEMLGDEFFYTDDLVCAWVPTLTSISRRSLFAGEKPSLVSGVNRDTPSEEKLWRTFWRVHDARPERTIGYFRGNTLVSDAEVDELVHDATPAITGCIINTIDNLMHTTMMGMPQMHDNVRRWMKTGIFRRFLARLLARGYQVYLTADHGNVAATGIGDLREGDLVGETSARARIYNHASFAEDAHAAYPEESSVWPSQYLGTGHAVLLADGLNAFSFRGKEVISHGSIALEEVFVPFVHIRSTEQCHR